MHQPGDRLPHVLADQVDHRVDVDPACHVADEEHQSGHADESQQDADAERQVGNERALAVCPDRAQHHQRIGERAEKGAERQLVAPVAGEVAQQPRTHLPGGKRQGGDGDGEHRAGDPDGGGRDRAQQRPCAGAPTVVEPRAFNEPSRHDAAPVHGHQADAQQDAAHDHAAGQQPERVGQGGEQLTKPGFQANSNHTLGAPVVRRPARAGAADMSNGKRRVQPSGDRAARPKYTNACKASIAAAITPPGLKATRTTNALIAFGSFS